MDAPHADRADAGVVTASHPLVAAALALHGVTPEQVTQGEAWRAGRTTTHAPDSMRSGLVHVHVAPHYARVDWDVDYTGDARANLTVLLRDGVWSQTVHLRHPDLPETALAGMTGRPLSDVLDVGGAQEARIAWASAQEGLLTLGIETTKGG